MSLLNTTFPNDFSVNYGWGMYPEDNAEAQKLLADALETNARNLSNGGARTEESEKRKLQELAEDGNLAENSLSKSSHNEYHDSILHDSEDDSQDGKSDHGDTAKRTPRKPGRKPLANSPLSESDPKQKRKAQNRAAQRAFRERKERYVKELEDRIKELENSQAQSSTQLQAENAQLKSLIQKLETENYLLKGANFTFDFPIDKAGLAEKVVNTRDPWTPPSSADSDLGQNDSEPTSPISPDSGMLGSPSSVQQYEKSPQDILSSSLSEPPLQSIKDEECDAIDRIFSNANTQTNYPDVSLNPETPLTKQNSFTEYREPSPYHNPFSDSTPIPPLFENEFDDYGTLDPMPTPGIENDIFVTTINGPMILPTGSPALSPSDRFPCDQLSHSGQLTSSGQLTPSGQITPGGQHFVPAPSRLTRTPVANPEGSKLLSFKKAWETISGHPRFEEVDIDQLCDEMKRKAKCSGHGKALEEEEVNNVLKRLDDQP